MSTATFIDIIIAILLPPLGVFLKFGCEMEFWICLILTFFGYLPGIIYAIYIITNLTLDRKRFDNSDRVLERASRMDERKVPWSGEYPESHIRQINGPRGSAEELKDLLDHRIGN